MGGTDNPANIIELSVRDHAEAHRQLYLKYGAHADFIAWKSLEKQIDKEQIFIETSSAGGRNNAGKSKSLEHRKKISIKNKGQSSHWLNGDIQQKKHNLSKSMRNNTNSKNHNSPEYKEKQSKAMKKAWQRRKNKKNLDF